MKVRKIISIFMLFLVAVPARGYLNDPAAGFLPLNLSPDARGGAIGQRERPSRVTSMLCSGILPG